MIIVEGMDNAGKSTVVESLQSLDPRLHVLRRPRAHPDRDVHIGDTFMQMLQEPGVLLGIADRFLASECVYGTIFRSGCRIPIEMHEDLLEELHKLRTVIVYVKPPFERILATWDDRPQLFDKASAYKLYTAYEEYMPQVFDDFPMITYDYTIQSRLTLHSVVQIHERMLRGHDG